MVDDANLGAAGRAVEHAVGRVQQIADKECPAAIGAEHATAGIGIAEKEAAGNFLLGIVGMTVELGASEHVPEIGPQLDIVVDVG